MMKVRLGLAGLTAAVAAVSITGLAHAANQVWDANGTEAPFGANGGGIWDTSSLNWTDTFLSSNSTWVNGNTAIFGDLVSPGILGTPHAISIGSAIVAQDIILGTAGASGLTYGLDDFAGGTLTLNGNINKATSNGAPQIFLNNGLNLGGGDHSFFIRDSPGDAAPELTINATITGNGNIIQDNIAAGYESWGTLAFNFDNSYTGTTTITSGRLAITSAGALGSTSAGTTIGDVGTLGIGGGGLPMLSGINIAEPITITRNTYEGGQYGNYAAAVYSATPASAGANILSGPITLNTADARFRVEGGAEGKLIITSNLSSPGLVSNTGAGILELTGDNTGVAGGFQIRNGTLSVFSEANLGGPNSTILFGTNTGTPSGGGYLRINNAFMTNFGSHNVNFATWSGGLDIPDAAAHFDITQSLAGNQIVKRGLGTLNLSGTNLLTGANFIDAGVMKIVAGTSTQTGGLRIRNGTLTVEAGASYTVTPGNYTSIAIDSGENGTLNLNGGTLIAGNADFNVSDLANTTGTINIGPNSLLQNDGINFVGKNNGSTGNINQTGGKYHVRRTGDFALVLGSRRGVGNYNMTGGELQVDGEFYIGQGNGGSTDPQGVGTFDQSGGTVTINSSVVLGREGASGNATIRNGAVFIKQGANNFAVDAGSIAGVGETPSTLTVDNATLNIATGEFRVGTGGGSNGTVTMRNNATITINNWLGVGRDNGKGVFNVEGGTFTKQGANNISVAWQPSSDGKILQTGGTFNVTTGSIYLSEGGVGLIDISGGTMNALRIDVGRDGANAGTLNVRGTGALTATDLVLGNAASVSGTVNLSGGSLKANNVSAGASSGTKTFNFTGGTLSANNYTLAGGLSNTGTGTFSPNLAAVGASAITTGYTQGSTATLAIDLESASLFDKVTVTGNAAVNGKLKLTLLGGYNPTNLVPHSILSATALTGIFSTIEGISLSPTKSLAVTYTGTDVLVQAARPGDASLDGAVNFNDLLLLAQNYGVSSGKTWSLGDFNGDSGVNFSDLLILAQNYGATALGDMSSLSADFAADWAMARALTPEPSSLLALGLLGVAAKRRRH